MLETKTCPSCEKTKPISDFYNFKKGSSRNHSAYCKSCEIKKVVEYRTRPDVRRRIHATRRILRYNRKRAVMDLLGGRCVSCGITDLRLLQVNHKNGRKPNERDCLAGHGGGPKLDRFYKAILSGSRDVSDLDARCANCNILYEYERGKRVMPDV